MNEHDYAILHRGNCAHFSGGYVPDEQFTGLECNACDEPFGFNVPIIIDEGRLTAHLSCQIAEGQ